MFRLRLWINRLLQSGMRGYLLIFAAAIFILASLVAAASLVDKEIAWNIFYALGINPVDNNPSHPHHWLYLSLGICGALVFGGLMVTVFTSGVERYVERVKEGRVRYKNLRNHAVVIGWNATTVSLISHLCRKQPNAKILLLCPAPTADVRTQLRSSLSPHDERRVIIYAAANQHLPEQLPSLCLHRAAELYLALDDDATLPQQISHLTLLEPISRLAAHHSNRNQKPLRINVMVNDVESYTLLQRLGIPKDCYCSSNGLQSLDIHIYNFCENWARLLWGYPGNHHYDLLDFEPIETSDKHVHLVIVGLGNMGLALLLQALRICHYPGRHPSRITIIDPRSNHLRQRLLTLIPNLDAISNIDIQFLAEPIEAPSARKLIEDSARNPLELLTVAICIPSPDDALKTALSLPEPVFYQQQHCTTLPASNTKHTLQQLSPRTRVLVRHSLAQPPESIIPTLRYPNLRFFGSISEGTDIDLLDDSMAITINGLYWDNLLPSVKPSDIDARFDHWRTLWFDIDKTPEAAKLASRYQADRFRSLIHILRRNAGSNNPALMEQLAESEHLRWIAERTVAGWRAPRTGEHRVDDLKIHNCIVPYNTLPDAEKEKDRNVITFAAAIALRNQPYPSATL